MTSEELENGIYGLLVNLCQEKAKTSNPEQARDEVAEWLIQVAASLSVLNKENQSE